MCFATQRRALFRHQDDNWNLDVHKWPEHVVFCTFSLLNVLRATTPCTCSTSHVLHILTSKCASRHKFVHVSHIATSKSGPNMVWLCILTSKCASRHKRVRFSHIVAHRNFQSGPNMVWLCILTSTCAWRVHFCISPLASWLCTRRFSQPTYWPSAATKHWKKHWKNIVRDFPTFSRACIFSLLTFSLCDLLAFDFHPVSASS